MPIRSYSAPEESAEALRQAMRRLASGVALLTAEDAGRRFGMPVTAVMSLSMEPPSLVVAVNRGASISEPLRRSGRFCVNLLKHGSETMCAAFAARPSETRFEVGEWSEGPGGAPCLVDAQAAVFCRVGPVHDFGTHSLVIGLVEGARIEEEISPLLHLAGRYCGVTVP